MLPPVADKDGSSHTGFIFLCMFGEELIKPNMQLREQYPNNKRHERFWYPHSQSEYSKARWTSSKETLSILPQE